MLLHLGGTTIRGPTPPLLMVTMGAKQGVELMLMMQPAVTIPIHFDDYSVFLSPLSDFRYEVEQAGLEARAVFLDRGEAYKCAVTT
jgi:L-ascorbate metabolism protein UlaG (beta-lactamase superfamily)